ncbi:MAG TPA: hypothetical protein VGF29_01615 [Hyphomicrobiaceae bacterium]
MKRWIAVAVLGLSLVGTAVASAYPLRCTTWCGAGICYTNCY